MKSDKPVPLKMIVFSALFAALIAMGSYAAIPIGPVPIVLSNFFLLLAALFLGSKWGLLSVSVFLLCGAIGLPVFSGGGAGIAHIMGPRGGYLFAYLPAVWLAGFISEHGKPSIIRKSIGLVIASLVLYTVGVSWLKFQTGILWDRAFLTGMVPFLIPDTIKITAALVIYHVMRPAWELFIQPLEKDVKYTESEHNIS
jgi:biotin transport system substrate-specific component